MNIDIHQITDFLKAIGNLFTGIVALIKVLKLPSKSR